MKGIRTCILIAFILPGLLWASVPDKRCLIPQGDEFKYGSGVFFDPFLICNTGQLKKLSAETGLLHAHFALGQDLSFKGMPFPMIGSALFPFRGGFDGHHHTLSDVVLNIDIRREFIAPFPHTDSARILNLTLDHVHLNKVPTHIVGGLIGKAVRTTLFNVHVKHIDMISPDTSGGLVGWLENSVLDRVSAEGVMKQHFGTDASGGLIGSCHQSSINRSFAQVDLTTLSKHPFGVSFIGGFIGNANGCVLTEVFSQGAIDYHYAESGGPRYIGGLIGVSSQSIIRHAYQAGKIEIKGDYIGGAIGGNNSSLISELFWDKTLSGIAVSDGGIPKETGEMTSPAFWRDHGFNEEIWVLSEGHYPELKVSMQKLAEHQGVS